MRLVSSVNMSYICLFQTPFIILTYFYLKMWDNFWTSSILNNSFCFLRVVGYIIVLTPDTFSSCSYTGGLYGTCSTSSRNRAGLQGTFSTSSWSTGGLKGTFSTCSWQTGGLQSTFSTCSWSTGGIQGTCSTCSWNIRDIQGTFSTCSWNTGDIQSTCSTYSWNTGDIQGTFSTCSWNTEVYRLHAVPVHGIQEVYRHRYVVIRISL